MGVMLRGCRETTAGPKTLSRRSEAPARIPCGAVTALPAAPARPALHWRPWTLDDVDALCRHALRVHEAENLESTPGADLYRWLVDQDGFDPATDSFAAFDPDGEVRAEVKLWAPATEAGARAFIWIDAAPPDTDLRAFLIAWGEARARQILAGIDPSLERVIRVSVEEHRTGFREQLESAGFVAARSFVQMRRSLEAVPAPPPLPDGVRVEPWSIEHDDGARLASNDAFADHWGSMPMGEEMWRGIYRRSDTFRPDLSFVAIDDDRVVALCLAEVSGEENRISGRAEVYVDRVGTARSHRRVGLASHLLVRCLQAAAAAGLEEAVLDVDESSHTEATAVYLRLGFTVTRRSITYIKTV